MGIKKGALKMPVCTLEHQAIYYKTANHLAAAGTLLFIHGSGASMEAWRFQMDELPPGFQGLAIDLPGHGLSPGPALDRVNDLAEVIIELVRQLELPRPLILAGHSLGAAISLQVAGRDSELLDGLILAGGGARMRVLPSFLEGLAAGSADPVFFRLAFAPQADPGLVDEELNRYAEATADLLFHDFTACNEFDVTDLLASVASPALLIVGEHDRLTPPKYSRFLQEKLGSAQLVVIPDAGHIPMLEKPGLVNQAIHQFVTQIRDAI